MNRQTLRGAHAPPRSNLCSWLWLLLLASATGVSAQTVELRQTSVPVGIVSLSSTVPLNSTQATSTAPESSGAYTFCYWTLNAVRATGNTTQASNPATFTATANVDAVAIYILTANDTDNDGLPDWWEYRWFGDLSQNGSSNPDNDDYTNAVEYATGNDPLLPNINTYDHGGLSRRRAVPLTVIQDTATYAFLNESSTPAGALQQTRVVRIGEPITLTNPPASTSGYYFTGWFKDGVRIDQPANFQPITVTPIGNESYVARYIKDTDDTDSDGLLDWKELYWFESLQYNNASDPDGDGFTIAEEEARNSSSLVADTLEHGGISRRRALPTYVDTTGRLLYRQTSDPATILEISDYLPTGTAIAVPDKDGNTFQNYQFSWWDLNGVRQADASGAALSGFNFTLNTPSTALAHYIDPTVDADGDGIKDWNEWTYYGSLANNATSDTDADGFSYTDELARNQSPRVTDVFEHGGISRRRFTPVFVDTTGRLSYRTTSNPETILNSLEYLPPGSVITVPDQNGSTQANYQFSWWTLNGVRQQDASGVALSTFTFTLNTAANLIGNYIDPTVDTDNDGIKDWNEWTYYGSLANGPTSDTDTDGFSYSEELARNQSPRVADTLIHGGISRRRSASITFNPLVAAAKPEIGALNATNISATRATINALVNPLSAATTANFDFGPTPAFGYSVASESILNGFSADTMGALLSNLQPDTVYYYRVRATNALGTSTSETANFRTLPGFNNFEQWKRIYGITNDFGDNDANGINNFLEYAFGMNPLIGNDLMQLPIIELINGRFRMQVSAPLGVFGVTYGAEWTTDMQTWTAMTDSGSNGQHEFWTPANLVGNPRVFVRWKIIKDQ